MTVARFVLIFEGLDVELCQGKLRLCGVSDDELNPSGLHHLRGAERLNFVYKIDAHPRAVRVNGSAAFITIALHAALVGRKIGELPPVALTERRAQVQLRPMNAPLSRKSRPYMFWLFLVSWTVVHANFEYQFWLGDSDAVFTKYAAASSDKDALTIGKYVYYTKATWMFVFVGMQVFGARLRTAVAWSFLIYSAELLAFFPFRIYSLLNLLLAIGCVGEDLILRRTEKPTVSPR